MFYILLEQYLYFLFSIQSLIYFLHSSVFCLPHVISLSASPISGEAGSLSSENPFQRQNSHAFRLSLYIQRESLFPVLCPPQRFSPDSPSSDLLLRKQARDMRIYSASSRSAAQRNVPEAVLKMPRSQPAGGLFGARKSRRNNIPPASFHPGSEIPLCHCGLFSLCRGSLHLTCLHLSLRSLWSCSCRRSVNGKRQVNTHNIQHNALGIRNQK